MPPKQQKGGGGMKCEACDGSGKNQHGNRCLSCYGGGIKLPTDPGQYWWREKDGDEWTLLYNVFEWNDPDDSMCRAELLSDLDKVVWRSVGVIGGQWAKAIHPNELTEIINIADKAMNSILDFPCGHKPNHVSGHCDACEAMKEWGKCEPLNNFRKAMEQ